MFCDGVSFGYLLDIHRLGDVVLVDIWDILNGFATNDLCGAVFNIAEPDIRVEPHLPPRIATRSASSLRIYPLDNRLRLDKGILDPNV